VGAQLGKGLQGGEAGDGDQLAGAVVEGPDGEDVAEDEPPQDLSPNSGFWSGAVVSRGPKRRVKTCSASCWRWEGVVMGTPGSVAVISSHALPGGTDHHPEGDG